MIMRIAAQYIMYTFLLAPTMSYACFYLVVFCLNIAQVVLRAQETEYQSLLIIMVVSVTMITSSFFYIFQKRELKRFF